jgi:hypothetical protein
VVTMSGRKLRNASHTGKNAVNQRLWTTGFDRRKREQAGVCKICERCDAEAEQVASARRRSQLKVSRRWPSRMRRKTGIARNLCVRILSILIRSGYAPGSPLLRTTDVRADFFR